MKLAIVNSQEKKCEDLLQKLKDSYDFVTPENAEVIICVGGDGHMLHSLHKFIDLNIPLYGINCGHLGFLMNNNNENNQNINFIINKIQTAKSIALNPLNVNFTDINNKSFNSIAFNEVSIMRQEGIASKLQVYINNELKLETLTSDGLLVSTPMGSTAYNKACGGPQVPLESNLLILTAINAFSPLYFKSAVLPGNTTIKIKVLYPEFRKNNLFCDFIKYNNIKLFEVSSCLNKSITLLFNNDNHITMKNINAQFHI